MTYTNQRLAYGNTLVALGKENDRIVVLDADLAASTMGKLFEAAFPERHFEMGIAEANMTSTAAGLAQMGFIPFTNSFAVFAAGRSYDQIRQTIAIGCLNVKICGSSAGLSDFGDGSTHQAVEDIAIMRAIPNMTVVCPADAIETEKITRAIASVQGPCYIRICRNDMENITSEDDPFVLGKPSLLKDGSDYVIFATGVMCSVALKAAESIKNHSVRVVNVSTIKPLDRAAVIEFARDMKGVVCAEEHSIIGGLGSAIAEALRRECKPIEFVGIEDKFGCSGHNYPELLAHYGLTEEHIIEAIESFERI
ncbi:MAG: transketolase family protein [Flexilinea flocculi]|jgi:transketolase|nr:transketolase family protein [Flexilinea flocculi]